MPRKCSSIGLHTKLLFIFISWQGLTKLPTLTLNLGFCGNGVSCSWHHESASPGLLGFHAMQKHALKEGKLEWSGVTNMERKQQARHCKIVQEWRLHTHPGRNVEVKKSEHSIREFICRKHTPSLESSWNDALGFVNLCVQNRKGNTKDLRTNGVKMLSNCCVSKWYKGICFRFFMVKKNKACR